MSSKNEDNTNGDNRSTSPRGQKDGIPANEDANEVVQTPTHSQEEGNVGEDDLLCMFCDYSTTNEDDYELHVQEHPDPPELLANAYLPCEHCPYIARSEDRYTRHLLCCSIDGKKPYICHICEYDNDTLEMLEDHVLTHLHSYPSKICGLCGFVGFSRIELRTHIMKHPPSDDVIIISDSEN